MTLRTTGRSAGLFPPSVVVVGLNAITARRHHRRPIVAILAVDKEFQ
ncbi:MAG: hypothetical protein R2698_06650 [Microthrixaceae bacterium]